MFNLHMRLVNNSQLSKDVDTTRVRVVYGNQGPVDGEACLNRPSTMVLRSTVGRSRTLLNANKK